MACLKYISTARIHSIKVTPGQINRTYIICNLFFFLFNFELATTRRSLPRVLTCCHFRRQSTRCFLRQLFLQPEILLLPLGCQTCFSFCKCRRNCFLGVNKKNRCWCGNESVSWPTLFLPITRYRNFSRAEFSLHIKLTETRPDLALRRYRYKSLPSNT